MADKDTIGIGSVLGGFQIEKVLGKGGMGVVYKAHELSLNRKVALKVLSERLSFDEEFVKRFKREAQIVAALNHPNIVGILSYGEEQGHQYFAMEYIQGKDLGQIQIEKSVIPTEEALSITAQVAGALDEAGSRGVVHRDLKPGNIMIDETGKVKVTDFGVAHFQDADAKLTRTGFFLGTPEYASPEQVMGKPLDVRSDIYSLGAVLYNMLSGEAPIKGESPLAVFAKITSEEITPIEQINPSVPKPVCELIRKMMARDPDARFQSPKEILAAIDACVSALNMDDSLTKTMVASGVKAPPPPPVRAKKPYGKVLGGMLGVALAVLVIVWIVDSTIRSSKTQAPTESTTQDPTQASTQQTSIPPVTKDGTPSDSQSGTPVPTVDSGSGVPGVSHSIAVDQLLVKGRFIPDSKVEPSLRLAGGVIRSNIGDEATVSPAGAFQFKNTKSLSPKEGLLLSAILFTEEKRIFRPRGGGLRRDLAEPGEIDLGEIPLEPYALKIEDIAVKVADWNGTPIFGESVRVTIGDKTAAWNGESFVGDWTFTKKDEDVRLRAEYLMPDGKKVLGQHKLSIHQFDLFAPAERPSPITIRLKKPTPPPLPKIPTVLIVVSGDETMRPFAHANIEANLLESGLHAASVSEIPTLYEKMQIGDMPITWYGIKQFVPDGKTDILLLADVQKTGSMTLRYLGRAQEQTTAGFSIRVVDMSTGKSAAPPKTGTVKFTSLNMEENFKEAVSVAVSEMGPAIMTYWQGKRKASKN